MKPSEIYDLEQQEKAQARVGAIFIVLLFIMGGGITIPWEAIALSIMSLPWYAHILLIPIELLLLFLAIAIIGSIGKALFQK